jgi:hypothetical protein
VKTPLAWLLIAIAVATASADSPAPTDEKIPTPSCDRIDYSHPGVYLPLSAHFGDKQHIMKVAATIAGKTPEEKLASIYKWVHSHLTYKQDSPYEWRDFDRLVHDGNYGGCADYSVVFGSLARACGIPTVWVKTLDAEWIRDFKTLGKEGSWNGHVFLEIYIRERWMLLDDTAMVLYEDYDPKMRILPGERYAYDKGGDPFDLVLSSRWQLWKKETRAWVRDFDLSKLPVGKGRTLVSDTKYPAVFVFYSGKTAPAVRELGKILYPKLTHHLTGRDHSLENYREQFVKWARAGDTVVLLLLASEKQNVPAGYQDLLPKPWSEMKAEADREGAAQYNGTSRGLHVIALVGKNEAELTSLIRKVHW